MQRKNKEIKQIFFDLDGTLLDTAPQFYLALSNVIERKKQEQQLEIQQLMMQRYQILEL